MGNAGVGSSHNDRLQFWATQTPQDSFLRSLSTDSPTTTVNIGTDL